jgi:hypothetical protein
MRAEVWFVLRVQNSVKWDRTKRPNQQSLILPGGALFTVAPEVHCLNIVGMVVSPRPAHSSRINVVGNDVVTVGERHVTDGALPVLLDNFSIKQFPHFRFGAKLAVSSRMVRVFDTLHSEPSDSPSLRNRVAATARERVMNGTVLIATEFHGFPPGWVFSEEERWSRRFPVCLRTDRIPFDP